MVPSQILSVSAVTVSGNSGDIKNPGGIDREKNRLFLNVATLTGTAPTADVTVSAKIGTVYHVIGTFTQATGATSETIVVDVLPDDIRVEYALGGTVTDFTATVHLA